MRFASSPVPQDENPEALAVEFFRQEMSETPMTANSVMMVPGDGFVRLGNCTHEQHRKLRAMWEANTKSLK